MVEEVVQRKGCQLRRRESGHHLLIHDPLRRQEVSQTGSETSSEHHPTLEQKQSTSVQFYSENVTAQIRHL